MNLNNFINLNNNLNTIFSLNKKKKRTKRILEIKTNFYNLNNHEVANFYSRMATYGIPQHHFIQIYRRVVPRVTTTLNWGPAGLRGCKSSPGCQGSQDFNGLNIARRGALGA